MFFFKKAKPKLIDLFDGNYVDIHNHILPGIDDGSKDFEHTKELIKGIENIGFGQFITTPHVIDGLWNNTENDITTNFEETSKKLNQENILKPTRTAAEYMMDYKFHERVRKDKLLTLKDNYLLVEMSYQNAPINLYDIIFDIQVAGYIPVLAHPERYLFLAGNYDEYKKIKSKGCKFQINLLSAVGYYGPHIVEIADKLLKDGLIDFSGSDIHNRHNIMKFENKLEIKNVDAFRESIKNNAVFKET
ncbi:MAG: histidinol phosphatase [Flavobacteriales bacterium]|nr:histidinol phosphatase [Flavobacteriales bacterium]